VIEEISHVAENANISDVAVSYSMPLALKKYITAAHDEENYKLTRAATLLESVVNFFHRT